MPRSQGLGPGRHDGGTARRPKDLPALDESGGRYAGFAQRVSPGVGNVLVQSVAIARKVLTLTTQT